MPRSKPVEKARVTCEAPDCDNEFVPQRSTARYCSATCRQRAGRARKAAASEKVVLADPDTGDAEHGLVRAVRTELEAADALSTVDGQIALQLARKLADPDHVSSGLAKELRATIAAAKGATGPDEPTPPASVETEDEVTKARKAREAKAAAAAGEA